MWQQTGLKSRSRESESPGSIPALLTHCTPGLSTSSPQLGTCHRIAFWVIRMIKCDHFCHVVNSVWFIGRIQGEVILYESGQASLCCSNKQPLTQKNEVAEISLSSFHPLPAP